MKEEKIIITFLGDRGPVKTDYAHGDKVYQGGVFAEALRQFCDFDRMLVCATDAARDKTWSTLEALGDPRIERVDIPTGRNTDEMWETFRRITDRVPEGCSVIFDITHGLRSLPFLVFLFAAYLKAAKRVTIDAIYYGALELGRSANRPGLPAAPVEATSIPAPVIDLSEFVTMLAWIAATDRFTQTGDGEPLATLLRSRMPPGSERRTDISAQKIGKQLEDLANVIERTSEALAVTHPLETMSESANMERALSAASAALADRAQPFVVLADQVRAAYSQFALPDAKAQRNVIANLSRQIAMINWYIKRRHFVHAATLAREWLVSVTAVGLGRSEIFERGVRDTVENTLNNAVEQKRPIPRTPFSPNFDADFRLVTYRDDLVTTWETLTVLRNDLAHCGMDSTQTTKARNVANKIKSIYPSLERVATAAKIANPKVDAIGP